LWAACSNHNGSNPVSPAVSVEKNFFITPEVVSSKVFSGNVDLTSGYPMISVGDLSAGNLSFSRSFVSKGLSAKSFGGWRHGFDFNLNDGIASYTDWKGVKSNLHVNAKEACLEGWGDIKDSAYNGQLSQAQTIYDNGICDIYIDNEIVASLQVRNNVSSDQENVKTLVQPDGTAVTFFNNDGVWKTTTRSQLQLEPLSNGWAVKTGGDATQFYNLEGQLTQISTPSGQSTNLSYQDGRLKSFEGPFGRVISLEYAEDRISKVSGSSGDVIYKYSDDGRLTEVVGVDGNSTQYAYDNNGRLISVSDAMGVIVEKYNYDSLGRVIATEKANGSQAKDVAYNMFGAIVTQRSNSTSETYEFKVQRGEMALVKVVDVNGGVESREYDKAGYPTSIISANGSVTTTTYNDRGLLVARTENTGAVNSRTTLTEWHPDFNKAVKEIVPGKATFFDYNSNGLLTKRTEGIVDPAFAKMAISKMSAVSKSSINSGSAREVSFDYTANGLPKTTTDENGGVTENSYDENGNRTSTTNSLGQEQKVLAYDEVGRPLKTQGIDGRIVETVYDESGRVTSLITDMGMTSYEYDSAGRRIKATMPDGNEILSQYDGAGNLTKMTDGAGNVTEKTYDLNGNILSNTLTGVDGVVVRSSSSEYTARNQVARYINAKGDALSYEYDDRGNQIKVTDETGNVLRREFDENDQLVKLVDVAGGETFYEYDANGNLTKVTSPNGAITEYNYDSFGQMVMEKSSDRGVTFYEYDAAGNQLSATFANGDNKTTEYDLLNRKVKETWGGASEIIIFYEYDNCTNGVGRLCEVTDSTGSTSYTYDGKGQVTSKTQLIDGVTLKKEYAYTLDGKVSQEIYPSGKIIGYTYDQDKLTDISINNDPLISDVEYDAVHQIVGWKWSDGTVHSKTYDELGRLKTFSLADTTRILNFDKRSNIIGWTDSESDEYKVFGFDKLNRLTTFEKARNVTQVNNEGQNVEVTEILQKQLFEYDGNGNRLKLTDGTNGALNITDYDIQESSNRLTQVDDVKYAYDENGNIVDDGEFIFQYDSRNRLVQVGADNKYYYNADNMRVKKVGDGNTTLYGWDDDRIYAEYTADGDVVQETVYLGDTPVATLVGGNTYRIHADQIDTPRVITDINNNVVWSWESKPFGESLPNEDVDNDGVNFQYNLRFPGQFYDQETGKHYNFNRDYDPATGRYIQSDPIGLDGGINTYGYVEQNPLSNTDVYGYYSFNALKSSYQGSDALRSLGLPSWAIPFIFDGTNGGTCAVRLSNAFNRAGYTNFLDSFTPTNRIIRDSNNLKYVMGAHELATHLGVAKSANKVNSLDDLNGKQGIAYFWNFHIDLQQHETSWWWPFGSGSYPLVGNGDVAQDYIDRGNDLYFLELPQ